METAIETIAANQTMRVPSVRMIMEALRQIKDDKERLAAEEKRLNEAEARIMAELLDYHAQSGVDSLKGGGVTVSFDDEAMRAKYDPEKWANIVKWAAETGNDHIVQRRLTDSRVVELVANGVALPDGLTLETYTKVSVRRV